MRHSSRQHVFRARHLSGRWLGASAEARRRRQHCRFESSAHRIDSRWRGAHKAAAATRAAFARSELDADDSRLLSDSHVSGPSRGRSLRELIERLEKSRAWKRFGERIGSGWETVKTFCETTIGHSPTALLEEPDRAWYSDNVWSSDPLPAYEEDDEREIFGP